MNYVFFHSDLDGYVAGAITRKFVGLDFKFIECNYDDRVNPFNYLSPRDFVIVVDYSFLPDEMLWCKSNCDFIWIDHHISAIKDSKNYGYDDVKGIREVGLSGAELAWKYFFRGKQIPRFVELVGNYDTFRDYGKKIFNEEVLPFFFGAEMFLQRLNPLNWGKESYLFNLTTLDYYTEKFVSLGKVIYRYKKESFSKINKGNAFVRELWGFRVLCLNTSEVGSLCLTIPETFDPKKHDMMCCYNFNGKKWSYGFYSNGHPEVDCSKIAKMFGGGGHSGASGCTTEKPIF